MSAPELKPCPFCGGKARMLGGPDAQEIYSVWCVDISCHVHLNGTMNAEATAAEWNRRPVLPGYTILGPDEIHAPSVERADAFEEVAKWHDKNARFCLEASKDDPRLNADDRKRAFEAHKHHAASAAAIRNKMSDERRAALRELMKEKGHG